MGDKALLRDSERPRPWNAHAQASLVRLLRFAGFVMFALVLLLVSSVLLTHRRYDALVFSDEGEEWSAVAEVIFHDLNKTLYASAVGDGLHDMNSGGGLGRGDSVAYTAPFLLADFSPEGNEVTRFAYSTFRSQLYGAVLGHYTSSTILSVCSSAHASTILKRVDSADWSPPVDNRSADIQSRLIVASYPSIIDDEPNAQGSDTQSMAEPSGEWMTTPKYFDVQLLYDDGVALSSPDSFPAFSRHVDSGRASAVNPFAWTGDVLDRASLSYVVTGASEGWDTLLERLNIGLIHHFDPKKEKKRKKREERQAKEKGRSAKSTSSESTQFRVDENAEFIGVVPATLCHENIILSNTAEYRCRPAPAPSSPALSSSSSSSASSSSPLPSLLSFLDHKADTRAWEKYASLRIDVLYDGAKVEKGHTVPLAKHGLKLISIRRGPVVQSLDDVTRADRGDWTTVSPFQTAAEREREETERREEEETAMLARQAAKAAAKAAGLPKPPRFKPEKIENAQERARSELDTAAFYPPYSLDGRCRGFIPLSLLFREPAENAHHMRQYAHEHKGRARLLNRGEYEEVKEGEGGDREGDRSKEPSSVSTRHTSRPSKYTDGHTQHPFRLGHESPTTSSTRQSHLRTDILSRKHIISLLWDTNHFRLPEDPSTDNIMYHCSGALFAKDVTVRDDDDVHPDGARGAGTIGTDAGNDRISQHMPSQQDIVAAAEAAAVDAVDPLSRDSNVMWLERVFWPSLQHTYSALTGCELSGRGPFGYSVDVSCALDWFRPMNIRDRGGDAHGERIFESDNDGSSDRNRNRDDNKNDGNNNDNNKNHPTDVDDDNDGDSRFSVYRMSEYVSDEFGDIVTHSQVAYLPSTDHGLVSAGLVSNNNAITSLNGQGFPYTILTPVPAAGNSRRKQFIMEPPTTTTDAVEKEKREMEDKKGGKGNAGGSGHSHQNDRTSNDVTVAHPTIDMCEEWLPTQPTQLHNRDAFWAHFLRDGLLLPDDDINTPMNFAIYGAVSPTSSPASSTSPLSPSISSSSLLTTFPLEYICRRPSAWGAWIGASHPTDAAANRSLVDVITLRRHLRMNRGVLPVYHTDLTPEMIIELYNTPEIFDFQMIHWDTLMRMRESRPEVYEIALFKLMGMGLVSYIVLPPHFDEADTNAADGTAVERPASVDAARKHLDGILQDVNSNTKNPNKFKLGKGTYVGVEKFTVVDKGITAPHTILRTVSILISRKSSVEYGCYRKEPVHQLPFEVDGMEGVVPSNWKEMGLYYPGTEPSAVHRGFQMHRCWGIGYSLDFKYRRKEIPHLPTVKGHDRTVKGINLYTLLNIPGLDVETCRHVFTSMLMHTPWWDSAPNNLLMASAPAGEDRTGIIVDIDFSPYDTKTFKHFRRSGVLSKLRRIVNRNMLWVMRCDFAQPLGDCMRERILTHNGFRKMNDPTWLTAGIAELLSTEDGLHRVKELEKAREVERLRVLEGGRVRGRADH